MTMKVIVGFTDLQDACYRYNPGDIYPRAGLNPSDARIKELAGKQNKRGVQLIEIIQDEPVPDEPVPEAEEAVVPDEAQTCPEVAKAPEEKVKQKKATPKKTGKKSKKASD